ncbi:MAG: hypothetical protein RLN75_02680 [Longimicrobiales bacterium]
MSHERLLRVLTEAAIAAPGSGFILGQAVGALERQDRLDEAMALVDRCQASEWWCDALQGFILRSMGRMDAAEAALRSSVAAAPDSVACELTDAHWLRTWWSPRENPAPAPPIWRSLIRRTECIERVAASDSIWWYADPLYVVEGHDRWAEYVARAVQQRIYFEQIDTYPSAPNRGEYAAVRKAFIVRRGPWDSHDRQRMSRTPLNFARRWTSRRAAR